MNSFSFFLVTSLSILNFAQAGSISNGTESVGGGGVMTCQKNGQVTATLFDFWEAEKLRGLSLRRNEVESVEKQAHSALERYFRVNPYLEAAYVGEIRNLANKVIHSVEDLRAGGIPPEVIINPPKDSEDAFSERGCQLEGVAYYEDRYDLLNMDYSRYDQLSKTDRAGLIVHEVLYKFLRDTLRVKNSTGVRKITSCLFAQETCAALSPHDALPISTVNGKVTPTFMCSTLEANRGVAETFSVFPVDSSATDGVSWRFQIYRREGHPIIAKAYFDVAVRRADFRLNKTTIYLSPEFSLISSYEKNQDVGTFLTFKEATLNFMFANASSMDILDIQGTIDGKRLSCSKFL